MKKVDFEFKKKRIMFSILKFCNENVYFQINLISFSDSKINFLYFDNSSSFTLFILHLNGTYFSRKKDNTHHWIITSSDVKSTRFSIRTLSAKFKYLYSFQHRSELLNFRIWLMSLTVFTVLCYYFLRRIYSTIVGICAFFLVLQSISTK